MKKLVIGGVALVASIASGAALAADMPVKAIYKAPPPPPTWSGFYLGINGGYGLAKRTFSYAGDPLATLDTCGGGLGGVPNCVPPGSATLSGGFGGLQIGYNWQIGPGLIGFEADYDWARIEGTAVSPFALNSSTLLAASLHATETIKSFGTVRARLGWLPTQTTLIYVTGGAAFARADLQAHLDTLGAGGAIGLGSGYDCNGPNCFVGSSSRTATGWTAGAGFEALLCDNVSIKAEYLYMRFGGGSSFTTTALSSPAIVNSSFAVSSNGFDLHVARVGLNFRFGG